jgi:hypothetical protein
MAYTNEDLANLIKAQSDRIVDEIRAASDTKVATPSASDNSRYVTAFEVFNEYQALLAMNGTGTKTFYGWLNERINAEN